MTNVMNSGDQKTKTVHSSKGKTISDMKQDISVESNECDMQVDDTRSSFTQSSSLQSAEKEEVSRKFCIFAII